MSPAEQIQALVSGFQETPPDTVAPCKKNKVHTIDVTMVWKDDSTPVRSTDIEIHRGKATYVEDSIVKGKHKEKNVPPGSYRIFFPEIDASEIEQG